MGGRSELPVPSPHMLSDIRSFPEKPLSTKVSLTAKASLCYLSQVTEMHLLCLTKEEGDLMVELLIFIEVFFS